MLISVEESATVEPSIEQKSDWPAVWSLEQWKQFKLKNNWLIAQDGKLGCYVCRTVRSLGIPMKEQGVRLSSEWASCSVTHYGQCRNKQLGSLRKKVHEHRDSRAHKSAEAIAAKTLQKDVMSITPKSERSEPATTENVFRTVYFIIKHRQPFLLHEALVTLQKLNGVSVGLTLHSAFSAKAIMTYIGDEMRKKLCSEIVGKKVKFSVILDEVSGISLRPVFCVYLRASVRGEDPEQVFLDVMEAEAATAASVCSALVKCLER